MIESIKIISPHQDDAAFSLGSVLAKLSEAKVAVKIVNCFTRSNYAPFLEAHGPSVVETRHAEDLEFARKLGDAASILDLDYLDAPLRLEVGCEQVCGLQPGFDPARGVLSATLRDVLGPAPTIIPLALGGHVDHVLARDEVLTIARGLPLAFYEDLPYASRSSDVERDARHILRACGIRAASHTCGGNNVGLKRFLIGGYNSQASPSALDDIASYRNGDEHLWMTREFEQLWLEAGLRLQ